MLKWIKIKNLALVEEADVEFCDNFNVITGETGAGKSVIIGAAAMLLGERADKNAIRNGAARCEISAELGVRKNNAALKDILENAGIDFPEDGLIQIRRTITPSSARNFINDTPVALQTLKELGDLLIDVHGPNEHQSLFRQSIQLELLDNYAAIEKEKALCAEICSKLTEVRAAAEKLASELPSAAEAEHIRLMISEIEKADPKPDEDTEISARHAMSANSRELIAVSSGIVNILEESETSVSSVLSEVHRTLQILEKISPEKAASFIESSDKIAMLVHELASDIGAFAGRVELDEKAFQELEERLSQLQTLKRRYGPSLENVFEALEKAKERLNSYENAGEIRNKLMEDEKRLKEELLNACRALSEKRGKSSIKFKKAVAVELNKLGFLKCDFDIEFSKTDPGPKGFDKIDFMFSANPGESIQPLRSIASSGEIARVMLALKTVLAESDSVPVLIFDEIDMNIGGETASIVGAELKKLAATHQILCISHLAQVAVQADRHFLVEKSVEGERTSAHITELSGNKRAEETARMLGGGKAALSHAKALLKDNV